MTTHTAHPNLYHLAVAPAASTAQRSAHETLTVVNEGTKPVHVTSLVETYVRSGPRCVLGIGQPDTRWVRITPRAFTLAPNQAVHAYVTANVPAWSKRPPAMSFPW